MALAAPSDLQLNYDLRRLQELSADGGTPTPAGSIASNAVILNVLAKASEVLLAHARLGRRYTEPELQALADDATNGQFIRGLVCDLAFAYLVMRRGTGAADVDRLSPAYSSALRTLQLLAQGEMVFAHTSTEAQIAAGTPRTADLTAQTTSPSLSDSWSQQASQRLLPNSPLTNNPYQSGYGYGC